MTYTDRGLWVDNVSDDAGYSIKSVVVEFRTRHNLDADASQIRALGEGRSSFNVWIGMPPNPSYRYSWTIEDSAEAGAKILELLEDLMIKGHIPERRD